MRTTSFSIVFCFSFEKTAYTFRSDLISALKNLKFNFIFIEKRTVNTHDLYYSAYYSVSEIKIIKKIVLIYEKGLHF